MISSNSFYNQTPVYYPQPAFPQNQYKTPPSLSLPPIHISRNSHLENKIFTAKPPLNKDLNDIVRQAPITLDSQGNFETHIPFNQINLIHAQNLPEKLKEFIFRFNGLCELICNHVLINDLLNVDGKDKYTNHLTIESLNEAHITNSHLLDVYSVFSKMLAFFFGIYPNNIFSFTQQWNLVVTNESLQKEVNKELLIQGLSAIQNNETLKLEVFQKEGWQFSGHSLLVKKISASEFIFFDPNSGEHRGLSIDDLARHINDQLSALRGTDIFFTRGSDYLKRLQDKKILNLSAIKERMKAKL